MFPVRYLFAALLLFADLGVSVFAQETKVVLDFESEADLKFFEFKNKSAGLSDAHVTHGKKCVKIAANEYLNTSRMPRDWSAFDALEMDVFVEGETPVAGSVLVGDAIWDNSPGRSYWNRHNG